MRVRGLPYSLDDYVVMSPFFSMDVPPKELWKTARQVTKTTNLSASAILMAALVSNTRFLFVAPLRSQILNVSNNYITPLLNDTLLRSILLDGPNVVNNILSKHFANGSVFMFSYAQRDVERVRSISADWP